MAKTKQPSQHPNVVTASRFAAKDDALDPTLAALFASSVSPGLSRYFLDTEYVFLVWPGQNTC